MALGINIQDTLGKTGIRAKYNGHWLVFLQILCKEIKKHEKVPKT